MPGGLRRLYDSDLPAKIGNALYRPSDAGAAEVGTIQWAESEIDHSKWPLLPNLVPIMAVDERSFACVIASDAVGEPLPYEGRVVRWHVELADEYRNFQAELLDVDCYLYVESVQEELAHRDQGWELVFERIGPTYEKAYIDKQERPRDHAVRPIRLACQNVIVGLAAIAEDSSFDGLSVVAWQTCERPHVATHEANRALAVVTLCDAFQNGGTMEIRFDRPTKLWDGVEPQTVTHPERAVPASLRRYAAPSA
jgi:hypothetical protein